MGCPQPVALDGEKAERKWKSGNWQVGSADDARAILDATGAQQVTLVQGAFDETLAVTATGAIAALHVDATLFESTKIALERFYDDVVEGGLVIVGAYHHWQGVHAAVDGFLRARALNVKLRTLEKAVWWVK
jgi:hypothetical protein